MNDRDYFAAAALQGLLAGNPDADCTPTQFASDAYIYAEAMLRVRNQVTPDAKPAVPEGWQVVPVVPTMAMMKKAGPVGKSIVIWHDMLASAPAPGGGEGE